MLQFGRLSGPLSDQALIVFRRNAVFGQVKTRLAASVGHKKALAVYSWLLELTLRQLNQTKGIDVLMYFSDQLEEPGISPDRSISLLQSPGNLGERLQAAFSESFAKGYQRVLVIGTDCPLLQSSTIDQALLDLQSHELVMGPAEDGGYYLLGLKEVHATLFSDISWSTDQVAAQTLEKAGELGLSSYLLPTLRDLDTIEDYNYFKDQRPVEPLLANMP